MGRISTSYRYVIDIFGTNPLFRGAGAVNLGKTEAFLI